MRLEQVENRKGEGHCLVISRTRHTHETCGDGPWVSDKAVTMKQGTGQWWNKGQLPQTVGGSNFGKAGRLTIQKSTGIQWMGKTFGGRQSKLLLRTAPVWAGFSVPCSIMFGCCQGQRCCSIPEFLFHIWMH